MADDVERISIELPAEYAAQIRALVASGDAAGVSSYVAEAVRLRLYRDRSLSELRQLFDRKGQAPGEEHLAWARGVLGVRGDENSGEAS